MPNERENKPFQFEPFAIQPWSGIMGQAVTDLPGKFCHSGFSATRGYLDFMSSANACRPRTRRRSPSVPNPGRILANVVRILGPRRK